MTRLLAAGAAVLVTCGVLAASPQPAPPASVQQLVRAIAPFSPADLARLASGEPIVRVIDSERREVAIAGAIHVAAPRETLLARHRDLSNLKSSDMVLQLGPIGAQPAPGDFAALAFEPYDLDTIRECEPGDCGVRLSTAQLQRFRREVRWQAPDWREQAAALWRRLLADYAADYLARGALADYRNKAEPLNVADEFRVLFDRSRSLAAGSPAFYAWFEQFPKAPLSGVENILYWSKDDFGLRPVTSLTHLALYTPPPGSKEAVVIGTRQIYATHYFDAALGLTLAISDEAGGFYLVCLNRARTRSLASFTRAIVRGIVVRRSRDATEQMLRSTRRALERAQ